MGNKIKKLFNKKSLEDLLYGLQSIPQARINNPAGIMLQDNELDEKTKQEMLNDFRITNDLGLILPMLGTGAIVPAPMIGIGDSMLGAYIKRKQNVKNNENKNTQFKCGGIKRVPRKKAFFGAIISGITNAVLSKNQYEDEQKRYEEQMALQKEQIAKNEMYNKLNSDIQSQLALQQNNDVYDNLRNFKCGGKIKRKRGAYGLYSSYTPFNTAPLGTAQIKLNLPKSTNISSGNNFMNSFGMASEALGGVLDSAVAVGSYLEGNLLADQKQRNQNALSKLENDANTRNIGSALNVNNINNTKNLVASNLNNATYNTYNTQMNELQKRRRGQLNSLYLS